MHAFLRFRLALLYIAGFGTIGIHMPFMPVWYAERGAGPVEIGLLLAAGIWVKVITNPLVGGIVDRSGRRGPVLILLALGALASFLLFPLARGFWMLLGLSLIFSALFSPIMMLTENSTLLFARHAGFDYGRVRLWGSLAFIAAATVGGRILLDQPASAIVWMIAAWLALLAAAALAAPDYRLPPGEPHPAPLRALLAQPGFPLFLAAGSCLQVSHAVYYGFATLHWRNAGLADDVIGWLWAEGVIAEILLFAVSNRAVAAVGAVPLMILGGIGGALRWSVTAFDSSLGTLVLVQALHAATFGAAHLGAMHYLQQKVAPELSAQAQGLYSSTAMGAVFGLAMLGAGPLYAWSPAAAFLAMAGCSAAGALLSLSLRGRT